MQRFLSLPRDLYRHVTFPRRAGAARGVYATFEQALANAPAAKPKGYAHDRLIQDCLRMSPDSLRCYDYPMIFWLNRILQDHLRTFRVFDVGGATGIHFYLYRSYLAMPLDLRWLVCELPPIAALGEEKARQEGDTRIAFTTHFGDGSGADLLLASGSLHCLDGPGFVEQLLTLAPIPKHLLLNRLPLYGGTSFVTLLNAGDAFYPQWILNRAEFVETLQHLGYELIDEWEDPVDRCIIPFYPEKSLDRCHGVYMRKCTS